MNLSFRWFLLVLSLQGFLVGCQEASTPTPDPCQNCFYPMECIDGNCIDPCASIDCGDLSCLNGECVCPTGFEGANCDLERIPRQVQVMKIWILKFPEQRRDSTSWDAGQSDGTGLAPDIYPWPEDFYSAGTNPYQSLAKIDASADSIYIFDLGNSQKWLINIDDPTQRFGFGLWDRDDGLPEDEYFFNPMPFLPYEPGRPSFPMPDTLTIGNDDTGTSAQVAVKYLF